ncbi:unnamed protein product, partial [Closterium sp. Naga37s-1]
MGVRQVLERTSKTNHTLIPCQGQLVGMQSSPPRAPPLPSWTATRGRGAKRSATQQILGSNHGMAPAMYTTQGNSASTSPTAFASPTAAQGSPTANERGPDVEGTCMGEPNPGATTHEASQQEEHLEGEGEDLPAAPAGGNQQGARGTSFAARVMEQVEGGNYDAEADDFAEEGRTAKTLNDDVHLQMEKERENAKAAREACASKEADLKEALAMATTLSVHVVDEQVRHVNVERLIKDSVNDMLFDEEHMNLNSTRAYVTERLLANSGISFGTTASRKLKATLKDLKIPQTTERRFNNRIGKIYSMCRYSLRRTPLRLLVPKRGNDGKVSFQPGKDFAVRCEDYVSKNSDKELGIYWHVAEGEAFSSPAFLECARLFVPQSYDPLLPIGFYPVQLMLILAV